MNVNDIVTPINVNQLERSLIEIDYDYDKRCKLVNGFREGFDLGYRGPPDRIAEADNLPFHVGDKVHMWNKVMKEVKLGHYAGPFSKDDLPYQSYIQSPIGLVPKSGGKTRLIFHLSYNFDKQAESGSVNHFTPNSMCTVHYKDLDHAVQTCLRWLSKDVNFARTLFYSKTDLVSAFRLLPIRISQRKFLLMKAKHPIKKIW